jgi:hypothetical protein
LVIVVFPASGFTLTGLSIGGKVSSANYSGDIFPGSGDVGSDLSYGLILGISSLPMLDFELRGGYFTKEFNYDYEIAGIPASASFEYRDISVAALAKKSLFGAPGFPFSFYAGAGLSWHWINTEMAQEMAAGSMGPSDADDPVNLFQNNAKLGGEGVAGIKLSLPAFPLMVFGEAKYGVIFTTERLSLMEFGGGLMIKF